MLGTPFESDYYTSWDSITKAANVGLKFVSLSEE